MTLLSEPLVILSAVGAGIFALVWLWSVSTSIGIRKPSLLSNSRLWRLMSLRDRFKPAVDENGDYVYDEPDGAANGSDSAALTKKKDQNNSNDDEDDDDSNSNSESSSSEESTKRRKRHQHKRSKNHNTSIKVVEEGYGHSDSKDEHRLKVLRGFHQAAVSSLVAIVALTLAVYHLTAIANISFVTRSADSVPVNPWRYIAALAIASGAFQAFVCYACQFHSMATLITVVLAVVGRVFLGLSLFAAPQSADFWLLAVPAFFVLGGSVYTFYQHYCVRASGPSRWISTLTALWVPLAVLVHTLLLLGHYATLGWWNLDVTIILDVVADVLLFLLPALYLLSRSYYKRSWPLFPRMLYLEYGLDHYWMVEARPRLLIAQRSYEQKLAEDAARKAARMTAQQLTNNANIPKR